MVVFIYGTTGELIKILPLIKLIPEDKQIRISTEQQPLQLKGLMKEAGIPEPHIRVAKGRKGHDLEKMSDMIFWLKDVLINQRQAKKMLANAVSEKTIVLVHGDTVTTVLGALFGRSRKLPVAHVEAGLRSGNWRHPFPEEIDRHIVSKVATVHFAPGSTPISNLERAKVKGEVIDTKYNTVLDSLGLAEKAKLTIKGIKTLPTTFFVASIHRNELMAQPDELKKLLEHIAAKSKEVPCIFLDHPITKERIRALNLDRILEVPGVTRLPKLRYFQFISLITKSDFIVTDSGGLQEESAYMGIPCLVHRMATERDEGLGKNVVLSLFNDQTVKDFMVNPAKYRTARTDSEVSPSGIIIDYLKKAKFI